uniref:Sulfurtransferase complex subunit TusB n=1 Tax=candidate division WOR-3 bacterium TaxID=2052148 RepID=A0A7C4UGE9_UNCW3
MKTLWMFLHTPNTNNIKCIQRMVDNEDAVIFLQNGVYASKLNLEIKSPVFYLKEDVIARGVPVDEKQMIDYSDLVELVFKYNRVVTF